MTTTTTTFRISRRDELYHDGECVGRFATEAAALDTAVRFVQTEGLDAYRVEYDRPRWSR